MHPARNITVFLFWAMGIVIPGTMNGQLANYDHPMFDIGFEASPHWSQTLHDDNGKVFEVINPNNNLRINLSYVPGCRNVQKHMKHLAGLKGMITPEKAHDTVLNDKQALILQGMCIEGKEPYRRMVVGIPGHDGLYIMEICCPEACYAGHRERMQDILGTLHVGA